MKSDAPAPQHPLHLLEELARRAAESVVDVTVHLAGGRDLEGRLLGFTVTRDGPVIALLATSTGRGRDAQTHVAAVHIQAVTVHDMTVLQPRSSDEPVPGRLELRRALAEASARLGERGVIFGPVDDVMAMDDRDRAAIAASLPAIVAALCTVLEDELGRAALAEVTVIRLLVEQTSDVERRGEALVIRIARAPRDRPASWRAAIDAAL